MAGPLGLAVLAVAAGPAWQGPTLTPHLSALCLAPRTQVAQAANIPLPDDDEPGGPSPTASSKAASPPPAAGGWDMAFLAQAGAQLAKASEAAAEEVAKSSGEAVKVEVPRLLSRVRQGYWVKYHRRLVTIVLAVQASSQAESLTPRKLNTYIP